MAKSNPTPSPASPEDKAKMEKKAAFETYQRTEDECQRLAKLLAEAQAKRGETVKAIIEAYGKGPFGWQGKRLYATERTVKDEAGNVTSKSYYFRGESEKKLDNIG